MGKIVKVTLQVPGGNMVEEEEVEEVEGRGVLVGGEVGGVVGEEVGEAVGEDVGAPVGALVGVLVGATVAC